MEKIGTGRDRGTGQDEIIATPEIQAIIRYIKEKIIAPSPKVDAALEDEMRKHLDAMSPLAKAEALYEKVMAYRQDIKDKMQPSAELVAEIKILLEKPEVLSAALQVFSEARADKHRHSYTAGPEQFGVSFSKISKGFKELGDKITAQEREFRSLEQSLFLKKITGKTNISAARSKAERLANQLLELKKERESLRHLEGMESLADNTDAVALEKYQTYKQYKEQMAKGFVWLPSRLAVHQKTIAALQNGRWPVLVGEAGTGKSDQADAAALELTGYTPKEIQCEQNTGEKQLIGDFDIDPATGGSFKNYGPLMQAFTGYADSREKVPTVPTGRIARFDESGRLGSRAYAVIKSVRQKREGDDFYGHPVLPGASAIWTTNPVGVRYPDRKAVDPAMRREIAEIYVDYPEKAELYDFMIAALLDENGRIAIAKSELAPAYKEFAIEPPRELKDGSKIVEEQRLIEDPKSPEHGTLWRLAGAVKALQDSFVSGNDSGTGQAPATLLRYKESADGEIVIGEGVPLTLSSSTITLGEVRSWMTGFSERLQKADAQFHTKTFTEWIQLKIATYIGQVDQADKKKVRAIFNYFGLSSPPPDTSNAAPISPKEIGYLSVEVPRPVRVVKPVVVEEAPTEEKQVQGSREAYQETEVRLDTDESILIRPGEVKVDEFTFAQGTEFMIGDQVFVFEGLAVKNTAGGDKVLAGYYATEKALFKVFSPQEVVLGIKKRTLARLHDRVARLNLSSPEEAKKV